MRKINANQKLNTKKCLERGKSKPLGGKTSPSTTIGKSPLVKSLQFNKNYEPSKSISLMDLSPPSSR